MKTTSTGNPMGECMHHLSKYTNCTEDYYTCPDCHGRFQTIHFCSVPSKINEPITITYPDISKLEQQIEKLQAENKLLWETVIKQGHNYNELAKKYNAN